MEDVPILIRSIINCDCPEVKRFLDKYVPRFVESVDPVFNLAFPNFQNGDDFEGFFLQGHDFHEETTSFEEMTLGELSVEEHICIENHPEDFTVEYRALLKIGNIFKRVVLIGRYRLDLPEPEDFFDDLDYSDLEDEE